MLTKKKSISKNQIQKGTNRPWRHPKIRRITLKRTLGGQGEYLDGYTSDPGAFE